ncbi:MAG: YciI family protein [Piscinibacter sp.]|nr:YciI family protein [Piscinibacter sp.]
MRYMIIVKANADSEAGVLPRETLTAAMADYHEQLARAGVLLDAAGLQPSGRGWRIRFDADGRRQVVDGPFPETKELAAAYTLIQVRSREEALEWTRRFPAPFEGAACEIEIRQLFELEDFGPSAAAGRFRDIAPAAAR